MIRKFFTSRIVIFLAGLLLGAFVLGRIAEDMEPHALGDDATNLVQNGSFELEGPGPAGADWSFDAKKMDNKGKVSRVASPKSSGQFAVKLEPSAANASAKAEPLGIGQFIPAAKIRANRLFVSAHLGAEGGASAVAGIVALRRNGSEIARAALSANKLEDGLTPSTATLEIPKPRELANLLVFLVANGGAGAVYFDDITITTAEGGAQLALNSSDPLATTIHVDAGKVLRSIPRELFGTNVEWIENGNGILDPRTGKFNETVVNLTREAGVSLIRYPGGLFSDHFHWRDSIGPTERRPMREHFAKGPSSKLLFGTDEALRFAKDTGAELLITANAGSGTAKEAAEWVEYIKTHDSGQLVRYWEIGNEIYMKSFDANSPPAFDMTPAQYADKVIEFAQAMRAVDPKIKLGAISADNFTTVPLTDHPNWSDVVLQRAGKSIDFVAVHNAYAPLIVDGKGRPRDVYLGLLAAPTHIRKNLEVLSAKIDRLGGEEASHIKIAVTEWGPFFQIGPNSPYLDHPKTLGSALFVASTLKAFLDSPKVEIANFFKLTEPTFMGWIGPRGNKLLAKAPLYALEIFSRHFGDDVVASEATSPTFDAPGVGLMPAARGVPWLEVVASKGKDGKLYLLAINKHFTAPATSNITLDGFEPAPQGIAWTLTGTGMDANTGTELPKVPGLKWAEQTEIEPGNRINKGNPSEVTLTSRRVDDLAKQFEYTFPPRSVTSIEMTPVGAGRP